MWLAPTCRAPRTIYCLQFSFLFCRFRPKSSLRKVSPAAADSILRCDGSTPLHAAIRCGCLNTALDMVKAGANMDVPDANGITAGECAETIYGKTLRRVVPVAAALKLSKNPE